MEARFLVDKYKFRRTQACNGHSLGENPSLRTSYGSICSILLIKYSANSGKVGCKGQDCRLPQKTFCALWHKNFCAAPVYICRHRLPRPSFISLHLAKEFLIYPSVACKQCILSFSSSISIGRRISLSNCQINRSKIEDNFCISV
jgi:hypothetical protein